MEGFTTDLSTSSVETVVVGGGLAGLSVAHELKKNGHSVVVLEKTGRLGGVVHSERVDDYLLEFGPNTVQSEADMGQLIDELDLRQEIQIAAHNTPRYILMKRRLHAVPLSPFGFLTTRLLSWPGKLRLLREPWVASIGAPDDESLQDFAERRLGPEVTHRLLAPFVAGIWASDIASLSAAAAFPKLRAWEQEHGSLLRGAMNKNKNGVAPNQSPRGLVGFKHGMSTLIDALARQLTGDIFLNAAPTKISRSAQKWRIETAGKSWDTDHVVIATPAMASAALLREITPMTSAALESIRYAPLTVVHMGFQPGALRRGRSGFGYLTLPSDKPDILGCVWNSDVFANRAPDGHTLVTVFVGGSLNPTMAEMPESPLEDHVLNALNTVMNVQRRPALRRVTRYVRAIPQYTAGHLQRMDILAEAENAHPGLHIIGNIRGGISVGDVIRSSKTCAARLISADTHRTA